MLVQALPKYMMAVSPRCPLVCPLCGAAAGWLRVGLEQLRVEPARWGVFFSADSGGEYSDTVEGLQQLGQWAPAVQRCMCAADCMHLQFRVRCGDRSSRGGWDRGFG